MLVRAYDRTEHDKPQLQLELSRDGDQLWYSQLLIIYPYTPSLVHDRSWT
jgi:hypothetical protein